MARGFYCLPGETVTEVQFGAVAPYFPPADLVGLAAAAYEAQGYDLAKRGSAQYDIAARTVGARPCRSGQRRDKHRCVDGRIPNLRPCCDGDWSSAGGLTCDALRRTPVNLAQQLFTLDHISKGRAYICLGRVSKSSSSLSASNARSRLPTSKRPSRFGSSAISMAPSITMDRDGTCAKLTFNYIRLIAVLRRRFW